MQSTHLILGMYFITIVWFHFKEIGSVILSSRYNDTLSTILIIIIMDQLAQISKHTPSKVWDESIYPFPNFNDCNRWSLGLDEYFHVMLYNGSH